VKPLTMLVTPDGKWVFPDSAEFFAALGDPDPDYDAIAFAVKNLGFVKLQSIGQSVIEVELHPRNVALPALLAVQQQLLTSQVGLFRINYFDTDWESEISSSAEHTIERLSELCAPVHTPAMTERFIVEPQEFANVFHGDESELRPLAQKWRVSFGHFDPSVISLAVQCQLLPRLMIAGMKPRDCAPVWRFIGDGHKQWIGENYQLLGVGEKVEDMPDKEYGNWASQFYQSVAVTGQPRYDMITAMVDYQAESGTRRQVRYERLMLPWKTPSDEVFVTMCSRTLSRGAVSGSVRPIRDSSPSRNLARSA